MARTVRTYGGHVTPSVHAAVSIDYVVVAYTLPASLFVPPIYIGHCKVVPLWGCATVYYKLFNLSHTNIRFVVLYFRSSYARKALALVRLSA